MPPFLSHLQRFLPWSNTRRAWLERLSFLVVAAAVAALVVLAGDLALWQQVLAWAALLVAAAVLFRNDWLKLFGPILWYDLVRTSRRMRTYLARAAYLLALLAILGILYLNVWPYAQAARLLPSQVARVAAVFCYTFLIAQYVLMVLATPAFTAGAVAEERQKKTIQFLLITDLRNHEIVLGKLASRMAHLGLLLLAGLPVLGLLELLGGVDPHLVLACFAGTAVTMASAAGLSILASVVARPARAAVILAYGWMVAYVVVCVLGSVAPYWFGKQPFYAAAAANPLSLDSVIAVIEAGNPVAAANTVFSSYPIEPALLRSLGAYSLFHGAVAAAATLTASLLVRRASLREPKPPAAGTATARPPVGAQPVLWKETYASIGPRRRWIAMIGFGLLVLVSVAFLVWGVCDRILEMNRMTQYPPAHVVFGEEDYWKVVRQYLNRWVRIVGTITAMLALVGVAVQAAQSIRVERDRETFDSLLTCPLTAAEILYGKWMGSILSVRWLLLWLAFVWGLAVFGAGLHPLAVPLLALTWCVYAAAMASIGLWFSLVARTSMRAVLYAILTAVGLSVGHWLLWLPCMFALRSGPDLEYVFLAQGGVTPPAVIGVYLSFGYDEHMPADLVTKFITFALAGAVVWGVFAWVLWHATLQRFKRDGGRVDSGAVRERTPAPHRLS
jgi:ABC-type transport system involved in multi-copper enzyme maturation permease subunit